MQVSWALGMAGVGWRAIQEPVLKATVSHSEANGEGQAKDSLWAMILYFLELKLHNQGNTVLEDKFYINFIFVIHGSSCSVKALGHWSSSYWTIAWRGNKGLGSCEPLVTLFSYMSVASCCLFQGWCLSLFCHSPSSLHSPVGVYGGQ